MLFIVHREQILHDAADSFIDVLGTGIKNDIGFITGNEKAKGKTANLWRYRALAGGFNIFEHEYIMTFYKA